MSECPTVNGGDRRDRWDGSRVLALVGTRIVVGFERERGCRVRTEQGQILDVGVLRSGWRVRGGWDEVEAVTCTGERSLPN